MPKFLLALLIAASCGGCGIIYKVDVHQGNLLDEANVKQLQPGLTKRQVHALLGSPMIADPFHQSRWDYVATVSRRGSDPEIKNLVLTFDGDSLATIEGDYFPEQDEQLAREANRYGNLPRDKERDSARRRR